MRGCYKVGNVTIDLNKEKAIDMIIRISYDTEISYTVSVDISCADSSSEARDMGECALDEVPDLGDDCYNLYNEIEEERKKLNKLPYHEILEKGESLGLWKLTEKQKRLI